VKILHISDLHFGEHSKSLATDLLNRTLAIKPDLIVCTGDVVDNTREDLFGDVNEYLRKLAECCAGAGGAEPSLIVVPGNHDYFKYGVVWKDSKDRFGKYFGGDESDHYFKDHGVWVFGFDSASDGMTGGGGRVRDEDFLRFHARYGELAKTEPGFQDAYKIVAIHHHPLPVNWDSDKTQRWLTMSNAGAFLSAALLRGAHLVLHGHEHLQSRAHLRSTLGGPDDHEITVLSLGATLKKVKIPEQNWFSVVKISGEVVTADFYESVGMGFSAKPKCIVIRSLQQQNAERFANARDKAGYAIERLVAYSIITPDGDTRRVVECESVTGAAPFQAGLPIKIPYTCGYLDKLKLTKSTLKLLGLPKKQQLHEFEARVKYPGALNNGSFAYAWYAVNSFAMNTGQFALQYSPDAIAANDKTEFTYFPVSHPVEEMTLVAQFPEGYELLEPAPLALSVGAGSPRQWTPAQDLEDELRASNALRFYEAMNVVSLRIPHPRVGAAYGIQWQVPETLQAKGKSSKAGRQIQRQVQALRTQWTTPTRTADERKAVLDLLWLLLETARKDLLDSWSEDIEASFLFFNHVDRSLQVLAAGLIGKAIQEKDYANFSLPYGMGIAGRAFKTNRIRIFAALDGQDSDEPDYYYGTRGDYHTVLACIPVRSPEDPAYGQYGVLCMGSDRPDCPLAELGEEVPNTDFEKKLKEFQELLNETMLAGLIGIYLNRKTLTASPGPANPGGAGALTPGPAKP
jgi:predicted phosphodiesterase